MKAVRLLDAGRRSVSGRAARRRSGSSASPSPTRSGHRVRAAAPVRDPSRGHVQRRRGHHPEPGADGTTDDRPLGRDADPAGAAPPRGASPPTPVLGAIFQADLGRLKDLVETGPAALSRPTCSSTSSTRPTSCSGRISRRARRSSAATGSRCRACPGCATSCCTCSARRARRTSAAPRTGSSSRSATTSIPATSRRPGCHPSCSPSSRSPRPPSRRSGIVLWPMVEFEADDAIAAAAVRFGADPRVERILVCTPDKDMAQLVRDERIVLWDRRRGHHLRRRRRPREVGRPADLDPGLARRSSATRPTASRACPAGAPSRPPPS